MSQCLNKALLITHNIFFMENYGEQKNSLRITTKFSPFKLLYRLQEPVFFFFNSYFFYSFYENLSKTAAAAVCTTNLDLHISFTAFMKIYQKLQQRQFAPQIWTNRPTKFIIQPLSLPLKLYFKRYKRVLSGPSCSKLTMLLVNVSLNL